MTILSSTVDYTNLYEAFKNSFRTNTTTSFSNLLWQFIVNDMHRESSICFTPVHTKEGLQISWVGDNEPGHRPTGVQFAESVEYDEAYDLCVAINERLFGLTPKASEAMIIQSMKLPEAAQENAERS